MSPTKIISSSANNMNNVQSKKYGLSPDEIEKNLYLVKDLEHFLIFAKQKEQNQLIIDLICMMRKNTRQKEEN